MKNDITIIERGDGYVLRKQLGNYWLYLVPHVNKLATIFLAED